MNDLDSMEWSPTPISLLKGMIKILRRLSSTWLTLAVGLCLGGAALTANVSVALASSPPPPGYFINGGGDYLYHPSADKFLLPNPGGHTNFYWEGVSGPNAWIQDATTGQCADVAKTSHLVYEASCQDQSTEFWVRVGVGDGWSVYVSGWRDSGQEMCLTDVPGSGTGAIEVTACVTGGSTPEDWAFLS